MLNTLSLKLLPSFKSLTSKGWAKVVLGEWHRYVLRVKVEGLETEVARLAPDEDGKEKSIWDMKNGLEPLAHKLCL